MAKLITTKGERAASSFLDWDDASLGRMCKSMALKLRRARDGEIAKGKADDDLGALRKRALHKQFRSGLERRRDRIRIAQRLRCHPVLAIRAVQIAAQHSETVGKRSGIRMEEGLLFDGITLHSGDISEGSIQRTAAVETNLADSWLSIRYGAAVAAGKAAHAIAI